jgi:fructose-specific phosphotransferase system IIA component
MELINILFLDCIKVPLRSSERQGVIDELVDTLVEHGKVTNGDEIKKAIWKREQVRTTGIGHGVAIPHGRCECVVETSLAIGRPATPVDFNSIDGRPVEIVFLLVSNPTRTNEHIQLLAKISRIMIRAEIRNSLIKAENSRAIYEIISAETLESSTIRRDAVAPPANC